MSHLTTSANTKTDAGAPGITGTSPGQNIGTDEAQDQSNTRQEAKHSHKHTNNKPTDPTSSKTQCNSKAEQQNSSSDSKDTLDVVVEPPVRANSPTPSGAPGATGASPNQPFGDESQDESLKYSNKHANNSTKPTTSEANQSNSNPKQKNSSSDLKDSLDVVIEPPVRANSPTPSGAPGATGASPNQPFGDESRDENLKYSNKYANKSTKPTSSEVNQSKSNHKQKNSSSDNKDSLDFALEPPVSANFPTPSGAPGATGASPNQQFGGDKSRNESPHFPDHPKPISQAETSKEDVSSGLNNHLNNKVPAADRPGDKLSATGGSQMDPRAKASTNTSEFDGPNASFSSEIGSEEDPGRLAEKKIFEQNAQRGDVGSMGAKQESITGGGQFEVLRRNEAA